jgi:hypothetical protein
LSRDHGEEVGLGHFGKLGLEFLANIVLEHDVRGGGTFRFVGIPYFLSPPLPGGGFAVGLESPRLPLGGKEWFIRGIREELEGSRKRAMDALLSAFWAPWHTALRLPRTGA